MNKLNACTCGGKGYVATCPMQTPTENASYAFCENCGYQTTPILHTSFNNPPREKIVSEWNNRTEGNDND